MQKEFLKTRLQISPTVIVVLDILYKMIYQIDTLYLDATNTIWFLYINNS